MSPTSTPVSKKRRVYLYSPVPPIKSGTAHYLELLLTELHESIEGRLDITLVIDKNYYKDLASLNNLPYPVLDYRTVVHTEDDVKLYFLSNNEFHRYVHRALYDHKKDRGLAVSIIHEPSMWMNVQAMCNLRQYGFNENDLPYFAKYEFGDHTKVICDLFKRDETDANFEYTSLAGTHVYENSDILVFHSQFALEKFALERSETYVSPRLSEPEYLVMKHPPEKALEAILEIKHKPRFVAGAYGWVQKTKQTDAIIRGFDDFYSGLSADDKDRVALDIVGQLDITRDFNPVAVANASSCKDKITFHGYMASEQDLNERMSEASLVFSLRFPSCGETSGPLHKANALNIPVVLSDYAAFAEEAADYHVPVEKKLQHEEIVRILHKEFSDYRSGRTKPAVKDIPSGVTINQVLDMVLDFQG